MNIDPKENVSKNVILTYARAVRTINQEQIDPYVELIEKELLRLYPSLAEAEDNAFNWAMDIINASSNSEVVETLDRIKGIQRKQDNLKAWHCRYCGKNTYSVDIEYLMGYDHIECTLKEDMKKDPELDIKTQINDHNNHQLQKLEEKIKQMQDELSFLKNDIKHGIARID